MADLEVTEDLLRRAAAGDSVAWGGLLMGHNARLCQIVAFRLDPRLRGRVDASDVVQDVFVEAAGHREDYFRFPRAGRGEDHVTVFLWLRGILTNKLLEVHRHHLGARMRDAAREAGLFPCAAPDSTSAALVEQLSGRATGPGTAAARSEVKARLREALGRVDPVDREVLALRHFEQLTNGEAAAVLGIKERAAAKRYVRALKRLKTVLEAMPGGLAELRL